MLAPLLPQDELFELLQTIKSSRRIVVCAHRGPDGDAVGSSLGWAEYLQSLGKNVQVILPNPFPDFLRWLPNSQTVKFYARHETACNVVERSLDALYGNLLHTVYYQKIPLLCRGRDFVTQFQY